MTEVMYQLPPRKVYSPPQISINGTNINAVGNFIYLGSIISNDATVSKDLDNCPPKASSSFGRLSKRVWKSFAPPLHKDPGIHSHCCSKPPVWCTDLGPLVEVDQATRVVLPMLLALSTWHLKARLCAK